VVGARASLLDIKPRKGHLKDILAVSSLIRKFLKALVKMKMKGVMF
jgi:hypothetical protein